MTTKTVQRGDNDVPQNSKIFLFPDVNVPEVIIKTCQNVHQELPVAGHWSPKLKLRGKTLPHRAASWSDGKVHDTEAMGLCLDTFHCRAR